MGCYFLVVPRMVQVPLRIKRTSEDLEAHKSGECIVMDLSKASEVFGITFSKYGGMLGWYL